MREVMCGHAASALRLHAVACSAPPACSFSDSRRASGVGSGVANQAPPACATTPRVVGRRCACVGVERGGEVCVCMCMCMCGRGVGAAEHGGEHGAIVHARVEKEARLRDGE